MQSIKHIICCCAALALLVAGCATTEQAFEPQYIGGYPTKETAERMFAARSETLHPVVVI